MTIDLREFCGLPPNEYYQAGTDDPILENPDFVDPSWRSGQEDFDVFVRLEDHLLSGAFPPGFSDDLLFWLDENDFSALGWVEALAMSTVIALVSIGAIPFSAGDPFRFEPSGDPPSVAFWLPEERLEIVTSAALTHNVDLRGVENGPRPCLMVCAPTVAALRQFARALMNAPANL